MLCLLVNETWVEVLKPRECRSKERQALCVWFWSDKLSLPNYWDSRAVATTLNLIVGYEVPLNSQYFSVLKSWQTQCSRGLLVSTPLDLSARCSFMSKFGENADQSWSHRSSVLTVYDCTFSLLHRVCRLTRYTTRATSYPMLTQSHGHLYLITRHCMRWQSNT